MRCHRPGPLNLNQNHISSKITESNERDQIELLLIFTVLLCIMLFKEIIEIYR